jgi:hypothetical protein
VVVVFCVVDVVIKQLPFVVMKNVTRILDLFLGFSCLGNERWIGGGADFSDYDAVGEAEAGHVDDVFVGDSFAELLLGLSDAGLDDCGFLLLLVVVEDGHFVALNHELYVFAEGDVGGFGPGEVEFLADDVGFGGGLDGEDLVGVGFVGGVGGGVLGVSAVFGFGVRVVGGGAAGGDFQLLGVHELAMVPVGGEGEGGGEEKCGQER